MAVYYLTAVSVALMALLASTQQRNNRLKQEYGVAVNGPIYRSMVFACMFILILVAGLRYRVGTDYAGYMSTYELRADNWLERLIHFNEPGIGMIGSISRLIYDDYATMFFNVAVIMVVLNVKTIEKYSPSFFLGIMLYIFTGAWHGSFNGMRQYLAAAVLFAGHRFIIERKPVKYLLIVLVASLFHLTALVMIPVYFLAQIRDLKKFIFCIVISSIVMRYSYDLLFSIMGVIKGHEQTGYAYMQTDVNVLRVLVAIVPILLWLFVNNYYIDDEDMFYYKMLWINALFMFTMSGSAYLARIAIYTEIYATIALPNILQRAKGSNKRLMTVAILICYCIFWMYELNVRSVNYQYNWIFNR